MNRLYIYLLLFFPVVATAGFTVGESKNGAVVKYDGKLVTEYVVNQANKPYLWPLIGPGGVEMTRAYPMKDVEGERQDHPHHRSVWFGHQKLDGFDTWHEKRTIMERKGLPAMKAKKLEGLGSTVHKGFVKLEGGKDSATIVTRNDYVASNGKKLLADERTLVFRMGKGKLVLDFDIVFTAAHGDCPVGDMKDSGFCVRVPTTMTVDAKKGGKIVNSDGLKDKAAWGKRAEWVSFTGPVKGKDMGIAILNHPKSFRHPTPWHVRTYGLFTANAFGTKSIAKEKDGSFVLKSGESFSLLHRVIFHEGDTDTGGIAKEWEKYAAEK